MSYIVFMTNTNAVPTDWFEMIVARATPHVAAGMPMTDAVALAMQEQTKFLAAVNDTPRIKKAAIQIVTRATHQQITGTELQFVSVRQ
jgi:hypothetical protein